MHACVPNYYLIRVTIPVTCKLNIHEKFSLVWYGLGTFKLYIFLSRCFLCTDNLYILIDCFRVYFNRGTVMCHWCTPFYCWPLYGPNCMIFCSVFFILWCDRASSGQFTMHVLIVYMCYVTHLLFTYFSMYILPALKPRNSSAPWRVVQAWKHILKYIFLSRGIPFFLNVY